MPEPAIFASCIYLGAAALLGVLFVFIDEPMHLQRQMSLAERGGHIRDGLLTTVAQIAGLSAALNGESWLFWGYVLVGAGALVYSCKDELSHHQGQSPTEAYIHALMFQLGALVYLAGIFMLLLAGWVWPWLVGLAGLAGLVSWQSLLYWQQSRTQSQSI